jgi:2-polyprenyl-3-methyl-5-hydroxy-6-metoxy-1,4-benzoquinol methylase
VSTCHACGSEGATPLILDAGADRQLYRCDECGFVYLASWQRSLENAEGLYDYYSRLTEEDLGRRFSPENRRRQQELLKVLGAYAKGRRLLDVGCGEGQILQTATDAGWEATGIDLSEAAVRICRRRGLDASQTDFFDPVLDDRRFDVITMSELIEHVPAPARFLRRAEGLLRPAGVLYLTTPNFGSLARRMLGGAWSPIHPEHIGYFERATLRAMVERSTSLHEIKIEANNLSPSTLVAWVRKKKTATPGAAATAHRIAKRGVDQRLRRALTKSAPLRATKDLVNRGVSAAGLGDTLVAWLQKPDR